ncbi:MAG TPA: type II toxin-antitoxin system RelE/ParE family toxin [Chakrabartia sp.]|nr:type II toxin-antitoxin system RelE/ParE family toxin [Chakrabartia sp.]
MAKLRLRAEAYADLDDIQAYGEAEWGVEIAEEYARGFRTSFSLLRDHPEAGPARPELGKGIRCLLHRKHRIFYRIEGDTVIIVRIVHGMMDARRVLKGAVR